MKSQHLACLSTPVIFVIVAHRRWNYFPRSNSRIFYYFLFFSNKPSFNSVEIYFIYNLLFIYCKTEYSKTRIANVVHPCVCKQHKHSLVKKSGPKN